MANTIQPPVARAQMLIRKPVAEVAAAMDSKGGFSFVFAGAKAFLEHGLELNLIADHDPGALVERHAAEPGNRSE